MFRFLRREYETVRTTVPSPQGGPVATVRITVPSPQGGFWGISPPNKAPIPPN